MWAASVAADGTALVIASGYAVPTVAFGGGAADTLPDLVMGAGDGSVNYYINNGALGAPTLASSF